MLWRLSGVGSKPFRVLREGNLGSYDPLFRPSGGARVLVAFTEGAFREQNLELSLARPAAMPAAGGDLPIAKPRPGLTSRWALLCVAIDRSQMRWVLLQACGRGHRPGWSPKGPRSLSTRLRVGRARRPGPTRWCRPTPGAAGRGGEATRGRTGHRTPTGTPRSSRGRCRG